MKAINNVRVADLMAFVIKEIKDSPSFSPRRIFLEDRLHCLVDLLVYIECTNVLRVDEKTMRFFKFCPYDVFQDGNHPVRLKIKNHTLYVYPKE